MLPQHDASCRSQSKMPSIDSKNGSLQVLSLNSVTLVNGEVVCMTSSLIKALFKSIKRFPFDFFFFFEYEIRKVVSHLT